MNYPVFPDTPSILQLSVSLYNTLNNITARSARLQKIRACPIGYGLPKNWFILHTATYGKSEPYHWLIGAQSHNNSP